MVLRCISLLWVGGFTSFTPHIFVSGKALAAGAGLDEFEDPDEDNFDEGGFAECRSPKPIPRPADLESQSPLQAELVKRRVALRFFRDHNDKMLQMNQDKEDSESKNAQRRSRSKGKAPPPATSPLSDPDPNEEVELMEIWKLDYGGVYHGLISFQTPLAVYVGREQPEQLTYLVEIGSSFGV